MTPDDLDQRIRAALDAAPAPEQASQLARLEQFWRQQSRSERRRARRKRAGALVVSILVGATLWFTSNRDNQIAQIAAPQREVIVEAPRPREMAPHPNADLASSPAEPQPDATRSSGREPTAYERLVFAARTTAPIDPEQAVIARLRRAASADETQMLVSRLAEIGTPRCIPALLAAAEQPTVRPQAIAALEKILGVDRLADAVPQTRSPAVRTALIARLLAAGTDAASSRFLALVADPATRGEALSAASSAEQLPVDTFVMLLDAPRKDERLAAAIVLGRVDGPAVSQALIARVVQTERASVETWVALLARRDETVERFLAQAARSPHALGQVNNARAFWARMMP